MSLLPVFDLCKEEAALVGRMLAGYGELEVDLMLCIAVVHGDEVSLKALFRTHGEKQRIEIADALARDAFAKLNLHNEFPVAIAAMHECRKMRNNFAHCQWHASDQKGGLRFVNLEEVARKNVHINMTTLKINRVDVAFLTKQLAYFENTQQMLLYLKHEAEVRHGTIAANPYSSMPKQLEPPGLSIP